MTPTDTSSSHITLGIDIGTTSIKACAVDSASKTTIGQESTTRSDAYLANDDPNRREQCPRRIFRALQTGLDTLFQQLDDKQAIVSRIGISTQMHGVVFWRQSVATLDSFHELLDDDESPQHFSNLITWEDRRCTDSFLDELGHSHLRSGFGCSTIVWLRRYDPTFLEQWHHAGSIGDLFVFWLTGGKRFTMSDQIAHSFGRFEDARKETDLLPPVSTPVALQLGLGHLSAFQLAEKCRVSIALGDMQCSTLAAVRNDDEPTTVIVNMGTSLQVVVVGGSENPDPVDIDGRFDVWPFFAEKNELRVCASLNGGNVIELIAEGVATFCDVPVEEIYARFAAFTSRFLAESGAELIMPTVGNVRLFGERWLPNSSELDVQFSVRNLGKPELLYAAICEALGKHIVQLLPSGRVGSCRLVTCGSALDKHPLVMRAISAGLAEGGVYERVDFHGGMRSAAFGAALAVLDM